MSKTTVTPAVVKYADQFYQGLLDRSRTVTVDEKIVTKAMDRDLAKLGINTGDTITIFEGKLSDLYNDLKLSGTYYSRIRKLLIRYDCITYLVRGTKTYDSILVLNKPLPPLENILPEDLTPAPGDATLQAVEERVSGLEHQLAALGAWRETLGGLSIEILRNIEHRLSQLEKQTGGK